VLNLGIALALAIFDLLATEVGFLVLSSIYPNRRLFGGRRVAAATRLG
jgi:hypothetical protein